MRRIFADLDSLEHLPDRVGEWAAARQHHDAAAGPERGQGLDDEIERACPSEQAATDLDHRVHRRGGDGHCA